jgi:hypothetical protein
MDVAIQRDGQQYRGTYTVERGTMRVTYQGRSKVARVERMSEEGLAALLLHELVAESSGPR